MRFLFSMFVFAHMMGCASQDKLNVPSQSDPSTIPSLPGKPSAIESDDPRIDDLGLHRHLGLERANEDLGYAEKSFETCRVGYGYSASRNCRSAVFVSINFQILCRDSEGTVSQAISREEMRPLGGRALRWALKVSRGNLELDGNGFGQIKTIFPRSPRNERLRLSIDNDFVYIRAGEMKRLVTPRNWCN